MASLDHGSPVFSSYAPAIDWSSSSATRRAATRASEACFIRARSHVIDPLSRPPMTTPASASQPESLAASWITTGAVFTITGAVLSNTGTALTTMDMA
jgi:hypothetical protein